MARTVMTARKIPAKGFIKKAQRAAPKVINAIKKKTSAKSVKKVINDAKKVKTDQKKKVTKRKTVQNKAIATVPKEK